MSYTDTWDSTFEGLPPDTEARALGAERIRDLKVAVRERARDGWWDEADAVTYVSTTQFKVSGDKTDVYVKNRAVKVVGTGGASYTQVDSASYSSPDTIVTVTDAVIDSGLSEVYYGQEPKAAGIPSSVVVKTDPVNVLSDITSPGADIEDAVSKRHTRYTDQEARDAGVNDASITQAKLKTSIGSVSTTSTGDVDLTLPGGEYGFYPQIKASTNCADWGRTKAAKTCSNTYLTRIRLHVETDGGTGYAQQRYVTSSGEVFWIFILRDKVTKEIIAMYQAPDHPCFGNGGKPLLVSHPFGNYDEAVHEIIVINPTEEEVREMKAKTIRPEDEPDKDLLEVIQEEYEIDEASRPEWPTKEVTVGLPPDYDRREMVTPIKKCIPKLEHLLCRSLRKRSHEKEVLERSK